MSFSNVEYAAFYIYVTITLKGLLNSRKNWTNCQNIRGITDTMYNDLQRRLNKFNIPAWNADTICFSMIWLVFHFRYGAILRTIQQCQSRSTDLVLFRCLKLALFIQVTICTRWPMTSHIQVITSSASNVEMTLYLTVHFLRELHFKCYARTWSNIMLYYIYKFYYLFVTKYSIFCILYFVKLKISCRYNYIITWINKTRSFIIFIHFTVIVCQFCLLHILFRKICRYLRWLYQIIHFEYGKWYPDIVSDLSES